MDRLIEQGCLDIWIDGIVPCLKDTETGELKEGQLVIKNLLRTSTISRQAVVLNPRKIKHLQQDQQLKEEQKMNITYHEENGYLLPNIVVGCDTSRPIGKYGRMRRKYLQEHRPILFSVMVQDGTLFEHLAEVEDAAQSRLETIVPA